MDDEEDLEFDLTDFIPKKIEKSIIPELQGYNLSFEIINKANAIYQTVDVNAKRKKRKYMIYFCVNQAYTELQIPVDPHVLAALIGVDIRKIMRIYAFKNGNNTTKQLDANDFIGSYCQQLGIDHVGIEKIKDLYNICINKDEDFSDQVPQIIAKSLIAIFCQINNLPINKKNIMELETVINTTRFNKVYSQAMLLINS